MEQKSQKGLRSDIAAEIESLFTSNDKPGLEKQIEKNEDEKNNYSDGFMKVILEDIENAVKLKAALGPQVFDLVKTWLAFIALMVFFTGCGAIKLSDNVVIALLTTTTVNILGLLYVVLRHFFPNRRRR
jgi:hypothetical protein